MRQRRICRIFRLERLPVQRICFGRKFHDFPFIVNQYEIDRMFAKHSSKPSIYQTQVQEIVFSCFQRFRHPKRLQFNPIPQMIAYIIEHITFHLRTIFLLEITVGYRHMMLMQRIFRYHGFLPDYHWIFRRIILVKLIIGVLFLIIMYHAQWGEVLEEQTSCCLQSVNNPTRRRTVGIGTYTPESPRQLAIDHQIRRFFDNLVKIISPLMHFRIPTIRTYHNKIIMKRKPLI